MRRYGKCQATLNGRCGYVGMCIKGEDPAWDGITFKPEVSQDLTDMDNGGWYCWDCIMCINCYDKNQDLIDELMCDETLE